MILGRDWLDMANPLIDWKRNSLVLRVNNELKIVEGVRSKNMISCKIFDKGFPSLQNMYRSHISSNSSTLNPWAEQYTILCPPHHWDAKTSDKPWTCLRDIPRLDSLSLRMVDVTPGEVPNENFFATKLDSKVLETDGGCLGKVQVKGHSRKSTTHHPDFISLKQAIKMAKKTDTPMFLCIIQANANELHTKK